MASYTHTAVSGSSPTLNHCSSRAFCPSLLRWGALSTQHVLPLTSGGRSGALRSAADEERGPGATWPCAVGCAVSLSADDKQIERVAARTVL